VFQSVHDEREKQMDRELRHDYESPAVTDHGDLTELTAAGHPYGNFDANYQQGDPIPPGGAGDSDSQP
jgi:hypothetical protein